MRKVLASAALLVAAFSGSVAGASNWMPVATAVDGAVSELDVESMAIEGATITVWTRERHLRPSKSGLFQIKSRKRYNCDLNSVKVLFRAGYDSRGGVVASYNDGLQADEQPIIPDSVGEKVFKTACLVKAHAQ